MSRKNRDKTQGRLGGKSPAAAAPAPVDGITATGKKVVGVGAASVALGFIVLSQADPMGRNWASVLSPVLILGGYAAIGLGIFSPEKQPTSAPPPDPSSPSSGLSKTS